MTIEIAAKDLRKPLCLKKGWSAGRFRQWIEQCLALGSGRPDDVFLSSWTDLNENGQLDAGELQRLSAALSQLGASALKAGDYGYGNDGIRYQKSSYLRPCLLLYGHKRQLKCVKKPARRASCTDKPSQPGLPLNFRSKYQH